MRQQGAFWFGGTPIIENQLVFQSIVLLDSFLENHPRGGVFNPFTQILYTRGQFFLGRCWRDASPIDLHGDLHYFFFPPSQPCDHKTGQKSRKKVSLELIPKMCAEKNAVSALLGLDWMEAPEGNLTAEFQLDFFKEGPHPWESIESLADLT